MKREELVKAVIADPDNDGPRAAFAMWDGDEQAKLTAIQLDEKHARYAEPPWKAYEFGRVASELIAKHGAEWSAGVRRIGTQPRFYRGFVEAVTLDVPTFLSRAAELYAIAPIRSVTIVDAGDDIELLAQSPHLARLRVLELYNKSHVAPVGDAGLRALAASPHLGKLAILRAPFNEITEAGVGALAASKNLPSLVHVGLGNNPTPDPVEEFGRDGDVIVNSSIELPAFGHALEAKYGNLRWLHGPSIAPTYPPDERDV